MGTKRGGSEVVTRNSAEIDAELAVELGKRLRKAREAAGLSQRQASAKSGGEFPPIVIGSYERGDRNVTIPRLDRLCRVYGVSVLDVIPTDPQSDARQREVERAQAMHLVGTQLIRESAEILSGFTAVNPEAVVDAAADGGASGD